MLLWPQLVQGSLIFSWSLLKNLTKWVRSSWIKMPESIAAGNFTSAIALCSPTAWLRSKPEPLIGMTLLTSHCVMVWILNIPKGPCVKSESPAS